MVDEWMECDGRIFLLNKKYGIHKCQINKQSTPIQFGMNKEGSFHSSSKKLVSYHPSKFAGRFTIAERTLLQRCLNTEKYSFVFIHWLHLWINNLPKININENILPFCHPTTFQTQYGWFLEKVDSFQLIHSQRGRFFTVLQRRPMEPFHFTKK